MQELSQEVWEDIPGYEGHYMASSFGRIKSLGRWVIVGSNGGRLFRHEKILALGRSKGYPKVELCLNGVEKSHKTHWIVGRLFVPNPEGKPILNHKDGVKTNCHFTNLEWATIAENNQHAIRTGLTKPVVFRGPRSAENRRKISEHRKEYWKRKKAEQAFNL